MRSIIGMFFLFAGTFLEAQPPEQEFVKNLSEFCGKSFSGFAIFPEGDKNPFKGEALKIRFTVCSDMNVHIPFQVGEDKSRTWIIVLDQYGLLLKHDHRHEDGTPDDVTMYGGYARAGGSAFAQHFPADAYTARLIPAAATNEWSLILDPDKKKLSYILKRDGQLRFHADFDLAARIKE